MEYDAAKGEALLAAVRVFSEEQTRPALQELQRHKAQLLAPLEPRAPSAEDRQRVQTRAAGVPGLDQLSQADMPLALQLSDELAVNETDAVRLLAAANQARTRAACFVCAMWRARRGVRSAR